MIRLCRLMFRICRLYLVVYLDFMFKFCRLYVQALQTFCSGFADLCSGFADFCSDFADLCLSFADFDLRCECYHEFSSPTRIDSVLSSLNIKPRPQPGLDTSLRICFLSASDADLFYFIVFEGRCTNSFNKRALYYSLLMDTKKVLFPSSKFQI